MTQPTPTASFPLSRSCPYQPPTGYDDFKGKGPLQKVRLFDGRSAWLVSSHAVAHKLLGDPRLSNDRTRPDFPALSAAERTPRPFRMLPEMDSPEHDIQRRMLLPSFTLKRAREARPRIEEITNELIDAMQAKGGPLDLVSEFAIHLPSKIVCELLGIPFEDHEFFQDRGYRLEKVESVESVQQMIGELFGYLDRLITAMENADEPQPGLLGDLVAGPVANGEMSHQELVVLALVMLNSGHVTTSSMIALGVFTLLEHPDQLALLRAKPELMPSAVDELLRYLSIADTVTRRIAVADIEIAGQTIAAGEGVLMPNALLNRDPEAFEEPDTFDITRSSESRHLALGFGVHQCIGQHLAKAEIEVALTALLTRFPTLRLAVPADQVPLRDTGGLEGVSALPVTW
ncbi:cytochrome P450 [Kitasatospora sp. NPDC059648]|uniref:cytochrome P450 n=1 Tax=Kitasatospora sp. NPDC059648 TaxID=3346894 RepID=UPI0036D07C34